MFPTYIDGYEDYTSESERIRLERNNYKRYGLSIFESFEEYMQDREEDEER
jgi:hypothetical protein